MTRKRQEGKNKQKTKKKHSFQKVDVMPKNFCGKFSEIRKPIGNALR